ncbi:MAG: hypothetical protein M1158_02620 [Candidatus Marsarchaeota archaeon]|jgi:predicted RNase H-like HicB family nuclease|nr:hypothetical protein [Candidatus Marsarchaeota archaeon]
MVDMRIFKSEGWLVAEIPSLHVVTRAKTMAALRKNIREAVEVAIDGMMALKSMKVTGLKSEKQLAYA